jgi:glycosyltransferase involved in cell wall biosynthesis
LVLVSVLLPSYNHEKYISESIESVLNQSFKDFELIIIDDFSKDNSRAIIETYQRKDKRIKAFFHEKNMGIASTLNDLHSKASGKYVAYVASDDVWDKLKLEKQLAILQKNDSFVVWSEGEIINENGSPTGQTFTQMHLASNRRKSGKIFEELLNGNYVFGTSLIYRRDFALDLRYDEKLKYLNDYEFMVSLAKEHEFFFIPEFLAKYRIHGKNSILYNNTKWNQERIFIYKYFLSKYSREITKETRAGLNFNLYRCYHDSNEKILANFFLLKALKSSWLLYEVKSALTKDKNSINNLRYFMSAEIRGTLTSLRFRF